MLHTIIAAPVADEGRAPSLQRTLALLAAGLDTRFIQAGATLASAIEAIDRIKSALDCVASALDERMAGAAVRSLEATAQQLLALPERQAARACDLTTIADAARSLHGRVMEMHQLLGVLRIYGTTIKIAAAGESHFVEFVDGMAARLGSGEQCINAFVVKLKELVAGVGSVQQTERLLAAECAKVVPAAPLRLASNAAELRAHLSGLADMAQRVTAIARDVEMRIGAVLGALQIGDITRQRLEHVVASLEMLAARERAVATAGPADAAIEAVVRDYVHRLLSAQLQAIAVEFEREVAILLGSLQDMGPDTARLLALIETEDGGDGRTFLQRLEQDITDVEHVTSQLREAGDRSRAMAGIISATVDELTTRLGDLRRVRLDVQDISTNTRLLCRRFGTVGKAVSVIATEIDVYAGRLDHSMDGVALPIRELSVASISIREDDGDAAEGAVGDALSVALKTIRDGCQRSERGMNAGIDDARQFIDVLKAACADVGEEMACGGTIREVAAALSPSADPVPVPGAAHDALRDILNDIARLYTMASERLVHGDFLLPGMAPCVTVAEPAADDDFDDAFF